MRWLLAAGAGAMVVGALALAAVAGDGDGDGAQRSASTTSEPETTGSSAASSTTTMATTTAPPSTSATTTAPSTTVVTTSTTASTGPAVVVRRGPSDRPVVALTFDAGSDTGYAAAILDTLAAKGIRASFGLTGRWTEANPALVARMAAEGHQLLNHTWSHPSFTGTSTGAGPLSTAERLDQLARAEAAIAAASGTTARPWFRPPYGDEDASVRADVGSAGYAYEAMWTVDSLGWKGIPAAEITERCLTRAEPGAIYLFHVGSASADAQALPAIIDGLRARGYRFATLAALVAS
jgi:peptidoglycan/xylan/chitin deacetylase (PgdA/CDA1 family)